MSISAPQINKPDFDSWFRAVLMQEITGKETQISHGAIVALKAKADKLPKDMIEMISLTKNRGLITATIRCFTPEQVINVWKQGNLRCGITTEKLTEPQFDAVLEWSYKNKLLREESTRLDSLIEINKYEPVYAKWATKFPAQIGNCTATHITFLTCVNTMKQKHQKMEFGYRVTHRLEDWLKNGNLIIAAGENYACFTPTPD